MRMGVGAALAASFMFAFAPPSFAGMADSTPGAWSNWADRAEAISTALDLVDSSYSESNATRLNTDKLGPACDGVRGMMVGTAYPLWAQSLLTVCDNVKFLTSRAKTACWHESLATILSECKDKIAFDRRTTRLACNNTRYPASQLKDTKAVASEPRVLPAGQKLEASFARYRKMLDC